MVAEPAMLDLFYIFVEVMFGNVLFAIVGISVILAVICIISRMSIIMTSYILIMFFMTMLTGFFGSLGAILLFTFSLVYFFFSVIPWFTGWLPG